MKDESEKLKRDEQKILNTMGKQKVISVLDKKIKNADDDGRKLEKEL